MDSNNTITRVEPIYDHTKKSGGHFDIYYEVDSWDHEEPFKLSFVSFLDHNVRNNKDLFNYLKKYVNDVTTMSDVIDHLYDIGFPVDDWVRDYMEILNNSGSDQLLNTLTNLFNHIKDFGK